MITRVIVAVGVFFAIWNRSLAEASTNPISPTEVASRVQLPPGFKVTLFAGEPDVRQPIAMAFDDRGRLWVAECYSYSDAKTNFDLSLHDRILIFEDSKGTGHFDKRTVFWDQGTHLTSIAPGFGGVYALCAPNLIFIPDRNGDDVPDGPPETVLDGWDDNRVRHNIVNGLKWGPDGWLYGRHGILATSSVGKPGTPQAERTQINCGIWRYHPTRKTFEVVCQGTTNPWGHDWDEHGQLFFINTVIGHLWQGIPGAYYKRMYGEPLQRFRYGLIDQAADHYHWDTGNTWQASREASSSSDSLGGGHAHSGLMIYQGMNWPQEYRGGMFTLNFHGRRINHDRLDPLDSGPVGKHQPDLVKFGDPWFRGIDLDYGPDGSVYVLDWSDTGECHGTDSVNRDTGRIYRIKWEGANNDASVDKSKFTPASLIKNSLLKASGSDLLALQSQPNEWLARHSRRLLQERAAARKLPANFSKTVAARFDKAATSQKLRMLFAMHAIGADTADWLLAQVHQKDNFVRGWAIRFLSEAAPHDEKVIAAFEELARTDPSATVRLELASALQRLALPDRAALGMALLQHSEDTQDRYLSLMIWYGIEPFVAQSPTNSIRLAVESKIPLVREYIARRIGDLGPGRPRPLALLLQQTQEIALPAQLDVLRGLIEAYSTRPKVNMPSTWDAFRKKATESKNKNLLTLTRQLGGIFADPWALQNLKESAIEIQNTAEERRAAVQQLIEAKPEDLQTILHTLLEDPIAAGPAARGLLLGKDSTAPREVLQHWASFNQEDRRAVVGLLTTRATFADVLLDSMASGDVPKKALDAFEARQIAAFQDEALTKKLTSTWGQVRPSNTEKLQTIAKYRSLLTPAALKQADLSHGRGVFNQTCAVCHKLYGQGNSIGPDLTGGGRASLDYLLENVLDPNAIVPGGYRVTHFELKDDRSVGGLILERSENSFTVQTSAQKMVILKSEIESMRESELSLMPEGLLQSLKDDQVRDLIAYLMAPSQVPLSH
jgi:putative membrane-bound dehydrogenase-like protein